MKNFFTFEELIKTDTGLKNIPPVFSCVGWNLQKLSLVLDVIRHLVGCAVIVNSAYRTEEVNSAVGGVPNSLHLQGRAADITCNRLSSLKSICKEYHQKGILTECVIHDNYIHIAI